MRFLLRFWALPGEIFGEILGEISGKPLGEILGEILGDIFGKILVTWWSRRAARAAHHGG